jgi:hypothetical protein
MRRTLFAVDSSIGVNYPGLMDHRGLWEVANFATEGPRQDIEMSLRSDYVVPWTGTKVTHSDRVTNIDFASDRIAHVIIECDGYDTHERDKSDIKRDRRRDRILQSIGFIILRYTGSEINDRHGTENMIDEMGSGYMVTDNASNGILC